MTRAILLAGLLFGSAVTMISDRAKAASYDGPWSVLVITESGACDRGYRYLVLIAKGHIAYHGEADVQVSGTVAANGAVKVSLGRGTQSAQGIGKLSGRSGAGTWRGRGMSGECRGRWEAEPR